MKKREIIHQIKRVQEKTGYMIDAWQEDQPSRLEMDLVLQYLREAYDCVVQLQEAAQTNVNSAVPAETPPLSKPGPVAETTPKPKAPVAYPEVSAVPEAPTIQPLVHEPAPVPPEAKAVVPEKQLSQLPEGEWADENTATLAEAFLDEKQSLNDTVAAAQNEHTIGRMMGQRSLESLRVGIGLNDKFLFVNELFQGSMQNYEDALEKLDHCHSLQEAKTYLLSLADSHAWNTRPETAELFNALVNRRYV